MAFLCTSLGLYDEFKRNVKVMAAMRTMRGVVNAIHAKGERLGLAGSGFALGSGGNQRAQNNKGDGQMLSQPINRRSVLKAGSAALVSAVAPGRGFAQTRDKISIINTASTTVQTMQTLLQKLGYLEQLGIEATTINVSDGTKAMGSLLGGDADIVMLSGISQVLPAIQRGAELKIVAGALMRSNSVIYSSRPDIKTLKDLEGRNIGAGAIGSSLHTLVVTLLRKNGVDPSKVTFINVGSATDVFRAVAAGTVDAGPAQVEFMPQAAKYNVHPLSDGAFWEQLPDYADQGSYTSDRAIAGKRDVLVRTLAAHAKLYRFVSSPDSKDAYLDARKTALGGNSDEAGGVALWEFIQKFQPYAVNLALTEQKIDFLQQLNIDSNVQKDKMPFAKVADMSLANDAVKLIGGPLAGAN